MMSAALDIEGARYLAPGDGAPVDFNEVIRSYAASVQFIAVAPQMAQTVRIQMKYSVAESVAPLLDVAGEVFDVSATLERSGDSLLIDDPAIVAALREAIESGAPVAIAAVSRDTGRLIIDTLPSMDFTAFDVCRAIGPQPGEQPGPALTNQISVEFIADPEPRSLATPAEARACGVTDPAARLYRGRLVQTTGFVSQTDEVFVAFDERGSVRHAHIPGIFDAALRDGGDFAGRVSVAADSNDAITGATVSGCLGAAPTPICDRTAWGQAAADGSTVLGHCFGDQLAGEPFEDVQFLSDFALEDPDDARPGSWVRRRAAPFANTFAQGGFPGFGGGFGGGGSGGGSSRGGAGDGDSPPPGPPSGPPPGPPLTVVPNPAGFLLLAAAVVMLAFVGRRARG